MKKTKLSAGRPSSRVEELKQAVQDTEIDEPTVRFNADIPKSLHKALKRYALDQDKAMTEILVELLKGFKPLNEYLKN